MKRLVYNISKELGYANIETPRINSWTDQTQTLLKCSSLKYRSLPVPMCSVKVY